MKRFVVVALAALFVSSAVSVQAADPSSIGRWSISAARTDDASRVQLRLEYSSSGNGSVWNSSWSNAVALAGAGIPADRLRGPMGPVSFAIQREPGTFNCVGSAGEGSGAGQFTYVPNARFDDALASRGMGRPSFHDSLELAIAGASLSFIDRIRGTGFTKVSAGELVTLRDHGVSPHYLADMSAVGYKSFSVDDVIALRDHGVTADFVSRLKAHGYNNLSVHDLIRLRDAGL